MLQSSAVLALKFVAVDIVGSVFYFPVWWYTKGMVRMAAYCGRTVRDSARNFGIGIWIKNLFRPMFGQHDIASRIISFFMRLLAIFYYSVMLVIQSILMLLLFLAWLALPLLVGYEFFTQLIGLARSMPA